MGLLVCRRLELVVFVPPKNACSGVKEAIASVECPGEAEQSGLSIHDFARRFDAARFDPRELEAYRWLAVLRNPYHRIVSAFFNKLCAVRSAELYGAEMSALQRLLGLEVDPARGLSFEEFIRGLELCLPEDMDKHWRPQASLLTHPLSRFEFVGRVDDSAALTAGLARYGLELKAASGNPTRYRKGSDGYRYATPWALRAEDLRGKRVPKPTPDEMFSLELKRSFDRVYAADLELYTQAFGEPPRLDLGAADQVPTIGAILDQVAADASVSRQQARIVIRELGDRLRERLSAERRVVVPELGVFAPRRAPPRTRPRRAGEVEALPERRHVVFKPRTD